MIALLAVALAETVKVLFVELSSARSIAPPVRLQERANSKPFMVDVSTELVLNARLVVGDTMPGLQAVGKVNRN